MDVAVRIVDEGGVDAAYIADGGKELSHAYVWWEIGEPESAVLIRGEVLHARVILSVHTVIMRREFEGRYGMSVALRNEGDRPLPSSFGPYDG